MTTREGVSDKKIELVDSTLNLFDALTKVIPLESFQRHRLILQIVQWKE